MTDLTLPRSPAIEKIYRLLPILTKEFSDQKTVLGWAQTTVGLAARMVNEGTDMMDVQAHAIATLICDGLTGRSICGPPNPMMVAMLINTCHA